MPRTRVVIQSRLNSSRLPGKALMSVGGMPLIELVARRAARTGHEVVVATSDEHYDDRIYDHLRRVDVPVMRGPLDDVLGRFVTATADLDDDDRVVRLTGDNPVMDAAVVDELLAAMDHSGHAYGRVDIDVVPEGLGAEGFWARDLRRAAESTDDPYDREHVTPWLRRELGELLFAPAANPGDVHRYRCTVDCLHDYDRVSRMFAGVEDPVEIPWTDLVRRLSAMVEEDGVSVPTRDSSSLRQSALVVGGAHLAGDDAAPSREVRALLAHAVDRGITHAEVGRTDEEAEAVLRACGEPQLVKRLQYVVRLAPLGEVGDPALAVCSSVERSFAELGRRQAAALLMHSLDDARGPGWSTLRRYRAEGTTSRIGVSLDGAHQVIDALRLPDVGYLELPVNVLRPVPAEVGAALAEADVVVTAYSAYGGGRLLSDDAVTLVLEELADELGREGLDDLCLAYVLAQPGVDSVVVGSHDLTEQRRNADLAARRPLTPEQVETVTWRVAAVRAR